MFLKGFRSETGAEALEVSLLEQVLILVRHHVGLDLIHEVHRHDHHDQQRGAAEVERNVEAKVQEFGNQANKCQVGCTAQRQAHEHLIDVAGSLFARTDARNKRTTLFQILCRFLRIEDQCRVEEGKEDDQSSIKKCVERLILLTRQ